jgi:hypothetical protein
MNENVQLRIGQWRVDPKAMSAEFTVNAVDDNGEKIMIQSEWKNKSTHKMAIDVACKIQNGGS